MRRDGAVALTLAALWFVACAGTTGGGGTQTNWVACRTNDDCAKSQICVENVCRAPVNGDAGRSDAASSDARDNDAQWLPPPGAYTCETREPLTFTQGNGQCVPPTLSAPSYCQNAYEPGAPGPEGCRPSIVDEFGTRCCYPGGCGFDDGSGCSTAFLTLSDDTVGAGSPCSAASTTPERIYEGMIDRVVLTPDSLVVGRFNGSTGGVTYITKDTCTATDVYSMANIYDLAATAA